MSTKPRTQKLIMTVTSNDLDELHSIFGEWATDSESEAQRIARKVLRAVRATEKKFGYTTTLNTFEP